MKVLFCFRAVILNLAVSTEPTARFRHAFTKSHRERQNRMPFSLFLFKFQNKKNPFTHWSQTEVSVQFQMAPLVKWVPLEFGLMVWILVRYFWACGNNSRARLGKTLVPLITHRHIQWSHGYGERGPSNKKKKGRSHWYDSPFLLLKMSRRNGGKTDIFFTVYFRTQPPRLFNVADSST